jgi:hypothetical protein
MSFVARPQRSDAGFFLVTAAAALIRARRFLMTVVARGAAGVLQVARRRLELYRFMTRHARSLRHCGLAVLRMTVGAGADVLAG